MVDEPIANEYMHFLEALLIDTDESPPIAPEVADGDTAIYTIRPAGGSDEAILTTELDPTKVEELQSQVDGATQFTLQVFGESGQANVWVHAERLDDPAQPNAGASCAPTAGGEPTPSASPSASVGPDPSGEVATPQATDFGAGVFQCGAALPTGLGTPFDTAATIHYENPEVQEPSKELWTEFTWSTTIEDFDVDPQYRARSVESWNRSWETTLNTGTQLFGFQTVAWVRDGLIQGYLVPDSLPDGSVAVTSGGDAIDVSASVDVATLVDAPCDRFEDMVLEESTLVLLVGAATADGVLGYGWTQLED